MPGFFVNSKDVSTLKSIAIFKKIYSFFSAYGVTDITAEFMATLYEENPNYAAHLAFDGNLKTHARTTGDPPNWFILKSSVSYSIDIIRIATHKPYSQSDVYVVSIGSSENSLAENKVCFYNYRNYNFNTFYCHITGNIVWIHRTRQGKINFNIYEIQVFTDFERKSETEVTSEGVLSVSSFDNQYPPAHLHDGDLTTYCSSASKHSWVQFKFSEIYLISHVEIKTHKNVDNYYWLRIGIDRGTPFQVPICVFLLKKDEFLKYWCHKKGNVVLVTRSQRRFRIYEIKVFKY